MMNLIISFYVFGLFNWGIGGLSKILGCIFSQSLMGHNYGSLEVNKSERNVHCGGLACEVSVKTWIQPIRMIFWVKNVCVLIPGSEMTVIDRTSVPLKWNLLCFVEMTGKYSLRVTTQKLCSTGTKATSPAGSQTWQCVRVPTWHSFWRHENCRIEGVLNRRWGLAPCGGRGQGVTGEGAVSIAMESREYWRFQYQEKSTKDDSKCGLECVEAWDKLCVLWVAELRERDCPSLLKPDHELVPDAGHGSSLLE